MKVIRSVYEWMEEQLVKVYTGNYQVFLLECTVAMSSTISLSRHMQWILVSTG